MSTILLQMSGIPYNQFTVMGYLRALASGSNVDVSMLRGRKYAAHCQSMTYMTSS